MIINHNIAALNTHRQLSSASSAQSKSMEKLASGMRINKAGDDAAGLAISEKMRGQIRGLDMASKNAQDGISLLQTAEGALNETHDILQRMRELAVQSSNDTNTKTDRDELQKEVNQLAEEITRISENTEFNTQNLLGKDGKGFEGKFHIGANAGQDISLQINDMGAKALGVNKTNAGASENIIASEISVKNLTGEDIKVEVVASTETDNEEVAATKAEFADGKLTITLAQAEATTGPAAAGAITATKQDIVDALKNSGKFEVTVADDFDGSEAATSIAELTADKGTIDTTKGIDISTQEAAGSAITVINNAIETVSAERSKLGATQNRLEHTINNLNTSSENLTAAESRIRDVDMAKEMMNQTKNSILSQAAQAMLAQANQQPQGVLQLLR